MTIKNKRLSLSVIIICYNEERNIVPCLEAVAAQIRPADEIIVVDNNCTDATVALASKFQGVKIVKETTLGMIYARNAGFNAANGDILIRIDADTRLFKDWLANAEELFSADPSLGGVTGVACFRKGLPLSLKPLAYFWVYVYFTNVKAFFGTDILWGAHMAIRSKAWDDIKDRVCLDDTVVHEDQDISLLLAWAGYRVTVSSKLLASVDANVITDYQKLLQYRKRRNTTRQLHRENKTLKPSIQLNIRYALFVMLLPTQLLALIGALIASANNSLRRLLRWN